MKESLASFKPLFQRYDKNPILTARDWPYPVNTVFNPGATRLKDGTVLLLCRVEEKSGLSHLCAARSSNGIDGWGQRISDPLIIDFDSASDKINFFL